MALPLVCFNMLWRYGAVGEARQTVNLFLRVSWFESSYLHHNIEENRPGDGIGIRVGLRSQILGVRVSSGAPSYGSVAESGLLHQS